MSDHHSGPEARLRMAGDMLSCCLPPPGGYTGAKAMALWGTSVFNYLNMLLW